MKKILKKAFGYQSVIYYTRVYQYEGKPQIGYVIVLNERMFFIPSYRILAIALDKEELENKLSFYRNYYNV